MSKRRIRQFHELTETEMKAFYATNTTEIKTRGGEVFPVGTQFEIRRKWGGLELQEIGGRRRVITHVSYWKLAFTEKAENTK